MKRKPVRRWQEKLLVGDCVEQMRALPAASVHCCITSPPYFGLRDYGHAKQVGREETPDAYVAKLVSVFREVRRVLHSSGTVWLNLGDSYAAIGGGGAAPGISAKVGNTVNSAVGPRRRRTPPVGLKPKDLIGIPWRVAFALQADGWYLRQDIIWHKLNPMPESVRDRCTRAHEYVFLLSKRERYFFDADAMQEPAVSDGMGTRNKRSVWPIASEPCRSAHLATFPSALARACLLAGCPKGGTVLDPFAGSGTTGVVAQQHDRRAILCELNPRYAKIARNRLRAARISGTGVKT